MRPFLRSSLGALALLAGSVPAIWPQPAAATPDDLFNRYFANVLDGPPCFARTFDDAHLNAHSTQRVRSIEIDLSKANADGTPNSAERFELGFALMLRTGPEWFGQAASCKTNEENFECFLEGDGGVFRLTPEESGGLRLDTGENGIALEGGAGTVELSGKSGDDRIFELATSKEECESASAFFGGGND